MWAGGTVDFLHWDGSAWNIVSKPVPGTVISIKATSSDNVWTYVRDFSAAKGNVLQWGGTQWTVSLAPTEVLKDIVVFSSTDVWAMGYASVYYHWDGTTWTTFSYTTPVPDADIRTVDGVAPNDLWGWVLKCILMDLTAWARFFIGMENPGVRVLMSVALRGVS